MEQQPLSRAVLPKSQAAAAWEQQQQVPVQQAATTSQHPCWT
jgi:hypothetical protein